MLGYYQTLQKIKQIQNEQAIRKASTNILDFTRTTMGDDFRESWHHRKVASLLDEFVSKDITRLILDLPPRHTKSEFVSRRLPAYILGKFPNAKVISCSYGADLASMMNRDVQKIMDEPTYHKIFPDTTLNTSNIRTVAGTYLRNSDIFEVVGRKGVYKCAGVGGAITGYGMDYGIIDDPIKNREEAESLTYREKIWKWYQSTFRSRRQKNAAILITMTRWHKDDLVGRLLNLAEKNPKADQWEVFSLPALTDDAPLAEYDERTGPGQALWPDEFPVDDLLSTQASSTVYEWLSLYQQRPVAVSGNLVSETSFKYCNLENGLLTLKDNYNDQYNKSYLISQCRIFQTCDPAASEKKSADYFSLGTWAQTPLNELALIDLVHVKMEKPKQLPLMRQAYQDWHPSTQWVATKGLGISLFQDLRANGLPVNKIEEESDKVSRFITACNRISTGTVYFLDTLPHKQEYKTQLLDFPNGDHDDMVDVTSMAVYAMIRYPYTFETYQTSNAGMSVSTGGMRI
jgi:phage uncharacterized protein (putative large terminase), C-terminal domain